MNKKAMAYVMVAVFLASIAIPLFTVVEDEGSVAAGDTLVVETSPDFAPYDYYYGEQFAGIDMDIIRAIAKDTGLNITFRQNNFDSIILSVQQHKCDFGASGFTISEDRKKQVDFTDPYTSIKQVVVAKIDKNYTSVDQIKTATISVQTGTSGADYADSHVNDVSQITYQKGYPEIVLDLLNGKSDCEIVDDAVAYAQVAAYPDKLKVYDILTDAEVEYYGFAFAKDNTDLYTKVNDSLKKLKANGTVDNILKYYADHNYSPDTPPYYTDRTLIVETSPDFAPYDYYYGNEFAGIDMDILRAIGKDIGYNIQFRQNNFDSIILSVQQHKCDFGASGFTINDERKLQIDFTDSYAVIKQVVVAPVGKDYKTEADIRDLKISVQTGTSGADYAEAHVNDVSQITYQKGYPEIVLDLLNGKSDCEIVDDAVAAAQVAAYPDKLKVYNILTDAEDENYGFVFAKDNTDLYNLVNNSLKKLKADGTIGKIIQYYADNGNSPDTPSYFDQQKTLYVQVPNDSPYEYTFQGKAAGIEVDILKKVAGDMGYRLKFVTNSDVSDIFATVSGNATFIGAAGFGSLDSILSQDALKSSSINDSLSLILPSDSDKEDTDITGMKVAVIAGSAAETYVNANGGIAVSVSNMNQMRAKISAGDADCAVADPVTTNILTAQVQFSKSYMVDGLSVISPKSSAVSDISGKKVAVIAGSVAEEYVLSTTAIPVIVTSITDLKAKLADGTVDCAVTDSIIAKSISSQVKDAYSVTDVLGKSDASKLVFVFSKDATALMNAFNTALDKYINDGTVSEIQKYYSDNGYALTIGSKFSDSDGKSWWDKLVDRFHKDFIDKDRYQYIVKGLGNTLKITGLALVIGVVIGILAAAVMSINAMTGKLKIPNAVCKLYVTVIRGTPVMVQLLLIYYVVFASVNLNQVLIAAVAFGLNSGAYVAEIVRSGINSVPKGQMEAARSLGLNTRQSMVSVVVPQAIRNILPALGNEGISLIKETSIAGYIGLMELTRGADIIRGQTYDALLPLLVIAVIYLAIVLILQYFIKKMEKRLNNAY